MTVFKAAVVQMRSVTVPAINIAALRESVREAAARGAQYVQTPEMTGAVTRDRRALSSMLAPADRDEVAAAASELARDLRILVHLGSTPVRLAGDRLANRSYLFAPDGSLLACYDKIHMFDVDLERGESWRESAVYRAGSVATVADLGEFLLGMAVCYDLRFPDLFRAQAKAGAQILTVPAAFTRQTGEAHWHVLLRARAIENGAWVIAAAQGGIHEDGRETYGHSLIIDPWGEIVAELAHDQPGMALAEIDISRSQMARARIPSLRNGRDFEVAIASRTDEDDRKLP